jgi:hypothetical protein
MRFAGALLLIVIVSCARPALGDQRVSPVQIDLCRLSYVNIPGSALLGLAGAVLDLAKESGPLVIKFTNEDDKAVTSVRFAIKLDQHWISITDSGTFSPGVTVDHQFRNMRDLHFVISREAQPKCWVTLVQYADGTHWGQLADPVPSPLPTASPA